MPKSIKRMKNSKNCRQNNSETAFFLPKRFVFGGPEEGPEGTAERFRPKRRVDVRTYERKYEETKTFLEGIIDGNAMEDMDLKPKQKEEMREKAQRALRELEGLPDVQRLSRMRDPKIWASEYFPKIAEIMERHFDQPKEGSQRWLYEHMRRAVHGKTVPDVLLHISGFYERRTKAANTLWDMISRLEKEKIDVNHPFMKILLEKQDELTRIAGEKHGSTERASKELELIIRSIPDDLELLVDKEEGDTKDLLAQAARRFRSNLGMPSREKEEEQEMAEMREIAEEEVRAGAVEHAIGRAIDKIEGRYGYEINGVWHDLPGNNPLDKGNPRSFLLDAERELAKIGSPDMTKTKVGETWDVDTQGFSALVRRVEGTGNKPAYKVSLLDISPAKEEKFPRIARYIRRMREHEERAA